jgi:hypothetical protein
VFDEVLKRYDRGDKEVLVVRVGEKLQEIHISK